MRRDLKLILQMHWTCNQKSQWKTYRWSFFLRAPPMILNALKMRVRFICPSVKSIRAWIHFNRRTNLTRYPPVQISSFMLKPTFARLNEKIEFERFQLQTVRVHSRMRCKVVELTKNVHPKNRGNSQRKKTTFHFILNWDVRQFGWYLSQNTIPIACNFPSFA